MAIRVIEVPLSVRFGPPPRPSLEDRQEPTTPMKKPVGVLGWTAEERAEYARTGRWPERTVEAPDKPPGLSLSSIPDLSVQSPAEPFEGTLSEALLILAADALKRPKRGRPPNTDKDFFLGLN